MSVLSCSPSLAEVVHSHYQIVLRTALGLCGDPHDAQDIAQDVFIEVMRALPGFRGDAALGTWIYRITIRIAGRHLSRRRNTVELPQTLAGHDTSIPIDLIRALHQLPFHARIALLLVCVEGQTHAEAARVLGIAEGTVSSRVHYARKRLSGLLGR